MLTRLGSRVAQEINFNQQKLKDGMVFRFLTLTTMFSVIMTNIYQFFSDSDRVPLKNEKSCLRGGGGWRDIDLTEILGLNA